MTAANLAAALVAFQTEMPKVGKGKTATVPTKTGGSYSYTYADLADLVEVAIPILTRHGLAFTARPRRVEGGDTYELAGVLTHDSGEEVEGALPIFGRSAQEIGSSITYGRRYLLGCLTGIVTDDDDDAQAAQPAPQTVRQPTAAEVLSNARMAAYAAWSGKNPLASQADFPAAYEADMGTPFADATATDFDIFTTHVKEL